MNGFSSSLSGPLRPDMKMISANLPISVDRRGITYSRGQDPSDHDIAGPDVAGSAQKAANPGAALDISRSIGTYNGAENPKCQWVQAWGSLFGDPIRSRIAAYAQLAFLEASNLD
jgi:hypothetical protein